MTKNTIYITIIFAISLILASCKTPQVAQQRPTLPIPSSFNIKADSSNVATINWRSYFSDVDLIELIDTSLRNNLDVLITAQRIEMSRANATYTNSLTTPFTQAGTSLSLRKFGNYTMDGAGNISTEIYDGKNVPVHLPDFYVGLQSSWEIDVWGRIKSLKQAALSRYLASVEGRNWVITNLIANIAGNYYELLALDNELEIIQKNISIQENALSIVRIQKDAGATNELAVNQFEAALLDLKSLDVEVTQSIVEAENRLNALMGRYPQVINRNHSTFKNDISNALTLGNPTDLLKNRPDIRQAEYELMATKADVQAAKMAFQPSVNLLGSLGFQAFNPILLFSPKSIFYNLLGGLTGPVFNRVPLKTSFATANAAQLEALYMYQKTIMGAYNEVYGEATNIKNLSKMHAFKKQEVSVLSKAIETSNDLFRTSRATYLEVLIAQQNSLKTQLNLANIRKRQLYATVNIYRALGGGWN